MKTKAALISNNHGRLKAVYAQGRRKIIAERTELYSQDLNMEAIQNDGDDIQNIEVLFSTWGMPAIPVQIQKEKLPNLKAVFYAAGSVQGFARPFLENNVTVVSAWAANAVPVAEFTVAQILLATKLYWPNNSTYHRLRAKGDLPQGPGNYGETIAILGAGMIGRKVIEILKNFNLRILVWDPFLSEDNAEKLGVEKVNEMQDAFKRACVVSNHLANLPETRELIKGQYFSLMRQNSTFINTGRGATVQEDAMAHTLRERTDITALLDVTWPEPPEPDSPLWALENVHISGHIAGSIGDEVVRMADYMIEEFDAWKAGRDLRYNVTLEMLKTMA